MTTRKHVVISAAVEGPSDEAIAKRLIVEAGGIPGPVFGKSGKSKLREQVRAYNMAAKQRPWFVLVDLDREECPSSLLNSWLPAPEPRMCFRVAVRMLESWLLADSDRIAQFLGISERRVPKAPESLIDPKQALIELARRTRKRDIKADMVPRPGSGRSIGPGYTSRLIEFSALSEQGWRPEIAVKRSTSLRRCRLALERLVQGG